MSERLFRTPNAHDVCRNDSTASEDHENHAPACATPAADLSLYTSPLEPQALAARLHFTTHTHARARAGTRRQRIHVTLARVTGDSLPAFFPSV